MRSLWSSVVFAWLLALPLPAIGDDDFTRASQAYAGGKFAEAKLGFEHALAHAETANTWYNLGNTAFRLGEFGRAALAYERALALRPSHAEAAANLRFVRQKTGARVLEPGWPAVVFGMLPAMAGPALAVVTTWLGLAWAGVTLWRRNGVGGIIGGMLLVALGAGYGLGLAWWRGIQANLAIVVVERAEARAEPSETARRTEALPAGSRVRIRSSLGTWNYCELSTGATGWIEAKDLERLGAEVAK